MSVTYTRIRLQWLATGLACLAVGMSERAMGGPEAQPDVIVKSFFEAVNAGDLGKVRSLLAENYQVLRRAAQCSGGMSPADCEVEWIARQWVQDRARLTLIDLKSEREVVRASFTASGNAMRGMGIERILVTKEFVVENGRIASMIPTLHTDDSQTARYRDTTVAFR